MTATLTEQITVPGLYDIPADVYHADPVPGGSLSASGAKKLLPPHCPATYRYERDNPPATTKTFEFGHAAHKEVLGTGPELVRIDADEWRKDSVKAEVAAVRARGGVPLKPVEYDRVQAMAAALRAHPYASRLFQRGRAEQSLFWVDKESGIWRRSMLDWLPEAGAATRLLVPDYKTCESADPETLQRVIWNYGYNRSAAWYLDGVRALGLGDGAAMFVFVFQEKSPPYLVTVAQPTAFSLTVGRALNREAIQVYRRCVETGHWPGYNDDEVAVIPLPGYIENQYKELASR
jgi:hypothetical protein